MRESERERERMRHGPWVLLITLYILSSAGIGLDNVDAVNVHKMQWTIPNLLGYATFPW